MEATRNVDSYPKADVQLWGKGYRITADSEEFQRYVPRRLPQPGNLERKVNAISWGSLLESLYSLPDREIAAQRCVLFDGSDLMTISFGKTEDRHRRPSLVLTTGLVAIDWRDPLLGEITARAAALSSRLATTYASTLRGNPDPVGRQLQDDSFLVSRSFDLGEEIADQAVEWTHVISAVKRWNGVKGISTPRLLPLGANVVLGTRYEADRVTQQFEVDGLFDVRDRDIKPMSDRLKPWGPEPETPTPSHQAPPTYPPSQEIRWVGESLAELAHSVDRLVDVAAQILENFVRDKRRR